MRNMVRNATSECWDLHPELRPKGSASLTEAVGEEADASEPEGGLYGFMAAQVGDGCGGGGRSGTPPPI